MSLNAQQLFEIGQVFDPRPEPALYYPTVASELLRLRLRACLHSGSGVPVLIGESGAGKTLMIGVMQQQLPKPWVHVAQLRFAALRGNDLLRAVAHALGMPASQPPVRAVPAWAWVEAVLDERHRQGEGSLLVVDDAHALDAGALLLLHRLSRLRLNGRPPLKLVLVGAPELSTLLASPELAEIAKDFLPRFEAGAFNQRETAAFVKERLRQCQGVALPAFTPDALEELHFYTQGVPGRVNVLCRELLHQGSDE